MTLCYKRLYIPALLLCLGHLIPAISSAQIAKPKTLTIEDGLSQGMIYDLLQTRDGFLWIGTKDGLNRYDGYNFRVWNNDPNNPYSISDNTVTTLFEDSRGWLWIGSENQGINLLDRRTGRFYHINLPSTSPKRKEILYDIRDIREDQQGKIWIANRGAAIYCLTIPEEFKKALPDTADLGRLIVPRPVSAPNALHKKTNLQEEYVSLSTMLDGSIWVGTNQQVYQIDPKTYSNKRISGSAQLLENASCLLQTKSGALWASSGNTVYRFKNGRQESFHLGTNKEIGTFATLAEDATDGIWILFEKKLWHVREKESPNVARPDYVIDKAANALSIDAQGNIWLGTLGYGLLKITPRESMFNAALPGTSIWGMWEDRQGQILCKLFNKIVRYNRETKELATQSAFPDALPQQNDLLYGPDGDMWLLCGLREGLVNKSQLRHYRQDHTLLAVFDIKLDRYPLARLLRTADGRIWITGTSGSLLRCDPGTGKMDHFNFGGLFVDQASSAMTLALLEDTHGNLWAGTQLGLVKGIKNGDGIDFQLYQAGFGQKNALSNNSVACLMLDPQAPADRLLIGTKGGGINCLDLRSGQFSQITMDQGLPNDVVYGLLADAAGYIWCSTNRGLARLRLKDGKPEEVNLFTVADGLQDNEFNTQAFFKAPNGELLFGGVNGLNYFRPESLQLNTRKPAVFIIGLEINRQPVHFQPVGGILKEPLEYVQQIILNADQNNLSFEFAALDFTDPAKNQYRYQLLPIESDWVEAGKNHFAHYTHLAPGKYVFKVIGSNNDRTWNKEAREITIVIRPPWWRSNTALFVYLLLCGLLIWQIYRAQAQRIRLREQIALEKRESIRIRALEQMKTNFFSNITHEFRTPLTLIIEPLRQVLKKPEMPDWLQKVRLAARNSQKLLHLINELLDLAKLESGAMQVEYQTTKVDELLQPVVDSFAAAAENKGVALRLSSPKNALYWMLDAGKVEKICFNLISNALKFTDAGYIQVDVAVQASPPGSDGKNFLLIAVRDSGKGIPAADLPNIFNRFYQSDAYPEQAQMGTGIGLALCRELAELMGGKITVESRPGMETIFTVYLPERSLAAPQIPSGHTSGGAGAAQQMEYSDAWTFNQALPDTASSFAHPQRPMLLLAEDNDELRAFLSQTLSAAYEVLEAADGRQALDLARQCVPDIVVSDIIMPYLDGLSLLDTLKKDVLTSHIPVLLLSSKSALESRLQGLQYGADAYLSKPFHTEELLAWLGNLLDTRRRLQHKFSHSVVSDRTETSGQSDVSDTEIPAGGATIHPLDRIFLETLRQVAEKEIENEHMSVEDLARQMAMSRSQLHRKLSALTGQSAGEFLRNYRLDRAMEMLRAKAGNVSEIAWRVGFSNAKYFSTSFKERFGVSPSAV